MKAIILAAGTGRKNDNPNESIPTCLMRIGKTTILERQIKILKKFKIEDYVVIIGKEGSCWTKQNISRISKITRKCVINPLNNATPNSSSLALGLKHFYNQDCIVIDGDLVFDEGIIEKILNNKSKRLIVAEETQKDPKGNFIRTNGEYADFISRKNVADKKYTGLIKLDSVINKKLNKDFEKIENQQIEYSELLNRYFPINKFKYIVIESIEGDEGRLFSQKPLTGGSFANTRVITKILKKTYCVVRKEANEGKEKLIDEMRWIKNLPPELAAYFPKILNYGLGKNKAWYEMEYTNMPTLRNLIMNKALSRNDSLYILKSLLTIMFSKFYNKNQSLPQDNYFKKVHIEKIKERVSLASTRSDVLKRLVNSKRIIVNGKEYINLPILINFLENDLKTLKELEPPYLCMVHGDLHLDNFTVDLNQMPMIKFILLDPRGLDRTYGYCYDLGKIWHSIHGKYDLTHEGLFQLKYEFQKDNFIANISYTNRGYFLYYEYLYTEIKKFLNNLSILKKDKNWELRTLFNEMAHFCSVTPFHIKYDEKENVAIALYIRGIILANELIPIRNNLHKWLKRSSRFVNINSQEDYEIAREIFNNGK